MNIETTRQRVLSVTRLLRLNGFKEEALELDTLVDKIERTNDDIDTLISRIRRMCHIKYLGDLHVEGVSFDEWLGLLESVKSSLPLTENE
ncbi:hypothetical protein [uncultured Oxalicibacterium sp.]|uniref:hypothetical protein n=1 Tax=uncultured Oxalicibacterium sp. TaxID=1168540 RepID=UPI0025D3E6C9|nr:hypothetical protein [uncultured Oxalicibacterium sp.]